jgi:heme-degrading monooxygenase HmoA
MYRVIFEHHPKEGQEEDFIKHWQNGSDIIQTYPGARGTKLFREISQPGILYAMAEWESKDARDAAIRAIIAGRPDSNHVLHGEEAYVDSHKTIMELECIAESNPPKN